MTTNNQSEQDCIVDRLYSTILNSIEQLYIESSAIGFVEFRKRIVQLITQHTEQAVLEARIESLKESIPGKHCCYACYDGSKRERAECWASGINDELSDLESQLTKLKGGK